MIQKVHVLLGAFWCFQSMFLLLDFAKSYRKALYITKVMARSLFSQIPASFNQSPKVENVVLIAVLFKKYMIRLKSSSFLLFKTFVPSIRSQTSVLSQQNEYLVYSLKDIKGLYSNKIFLVGFPFRVFSLGNLCTTNKSTF